ncbi:hypothetical protein HNY73_000040 [Argiope bruennichi]|uniref:CCHC-type domain-containing protein n=1 Tax=Argiope bruennichi TaxID=94029 RepID=A0A8T0G0R4_ARGBR|nr:hypothetical protein HNY73_000040 [Argiope bruennichi]
MYKKQIYSQRRSILVWQENLSPRKLIVLKGFQGKTELFLGTCISESADRPGAPERTLVFLRDFLHHRLTLLKPPADIKSLPGWPVASQSLSNFEKRRVPSLANNGQIQFPAQKKIILPDVIRRGTNGNSFLARDSIMEKHHDDPMAGPYGEEGTFQELQALLLDGMRKYINDYVKIVQNAKQIESKQPEGQLVHSAKEKTVLLMPDNHSSHVNITVVNKALDNHIIRFSFPLHCSHHLHSLYVGDYGSFPNYLNIGQTTWMNINPCKTMNIYDIPNTVKDCSSLAVNAVNIMSGFKEVEKLPNWRSKAQTESKASFPVKKEEREDKKSSAHFDDFEKRRDLRCYKCGSREHIRPDCPLFRNVRNSETVNHLSGTDEDEIIAPYTSISEVKGFSMPILRDTGSIIDVICLKVINSEMFTGEHVWVQQPLEEGPISLPLAEVELQGDFGHLKNFGKD